MATIESLAGARVYLDANILIYYVEKTAGWREAAGLLFDALIAGESDIVTSEISVGECLYQPMRDKNRALVALYEDFLGGEEIRRVAVNLDIIRAAASLAGDSGLKLIDAIHVATAIDSRCGFFVTNDSRIRSIPGLRVLRLSEIDGPATDG